MVKQRARGISIESNAIMWMHRRDFTGTVIKFDEGDYYGNFSRSSSRVVTRKRGH